MVLLALWTSPSASAHTTRIASDPAENAVLTAVPTQVTATFNEPVQAAFASMAVVGPDGDVRSDGSPRVDGAVLSVDVKPDGPAGRYTVNYRVTSADGHPVTAGWSFDVNSPGSTASSPTAAPAAAEESEDGFPWWVIGVGVAVVLGAGGVLVALWMGRGRKP